MRCFIAFDVEDKEVLNEIVKAQKDLLETRANLKLVELKNIHLTIRFLGEISDVKARMVYESMQKISFAPFDIQLKGVGTFPNLSRPRVIWIGVGKGAEELKKIHDQLEVHLVKIGFPPEEERFSPHLTIARVRNLSRIAKLSEKIEKFSNYEFGIIRANCLKLKSSILTSKGPIYSDVYCVRASQI